MCVLPPEERAKDLAWLQTRSFWTSAERWVFCQLMRRAEARLKQGPDRPRRPVAGSGLQDEGSQPTLGCGISLGFFLAKNWEGGEVVPKPQTVSS